MKRFTLKQTTQAIKQTTQPTRTLRASCPLSADFFPIRTTDIPVLHQVGQLQSETGAVTLPTTREISGFSLNELKQFIVSRQWNTSQGGDIKLSGKDRTLKILQQEVLAKIASVGESKPNNANSHRDLIVSDAGDIFATSADLMPWSCDGWSMADLPAMRAPEKCLEILSKLGAQVLQHQSGLVSRPVRTTKWGNFKVQLVPKILFQGHVIAEEPCVRMTLSHVARGPPELNLAEICGTAGDSIVGLQIQTTTRGRGSRGEIVGHAGNLGEGKLRDKLLGLSSCPEMRASIESASDHEPCWRVRLGHGKSGKEFTFLGSKLRPTLIPANLQRLDRIMGYEASAQIGRDSIIPPKERKGFLDAELARISKSVPKVTKTLFPSAPSRIASPGTCAERFISFDEPKLLVGKGKSTAAGGALWANMARNGLYLYGDIGKTLDMRGYILGSPSQRDVDKAHDTFRSITQIFGQMHIKADAEPSRVKNVKSVPEALAHAEKEGAQAVVLFSRSVQGYQTAKQACLKIRPPGLHHLASQWVDLSRPPHKEPALKNIVLQMCAKLGHIPYILQSSENQSSAPKELICGIDVCHMQNPKSREMYHVTGGIQLQQRSGEMLNSWLFNGRIQGESIPDSIWMKALTKDMCSGQKVVVHRDGRFTTSEKEFLAQHAKDINAAGPIGLVEIVKYAGGTPRMYSGSDNAPGGSCLVLSETECILTSGSYRSNHGTRNPLLVRIVGSTSTETTSGLSIKRVAEDIFRLSFLSYASLYLTPRLPVSTKTADMAAYVHASFSSQGSSGGLNSILVSHGKQQYWL